VNRSDIKDDILRDWWEREFKGRDHENWPFCDPSYSTVMPGADFTVAIREFLIAGKLEAIRELLWMVSTESTSWGLQLDLVMEALASQAYPDTDEGRMLAELDAVVVLGMRSAFHTSRDESYVITTMAKCSLPVWLADEKSQPAVKSLRTMPVTCRDMILERVQPPFSPSPIPSTAPSSAPRKKQIPSNKSGRGSFQVPYGGGRFRVETSLGAITVFGTEFSVALQPEEATQATQATQNQTT
jgi:hypothetical protein